MVGDHSETYAIGDAHMNMCKNCNGSFRRWFVKIRRIQKHHLSYLDFFDLQLNAANDWLMMSLDHNPS